MKMMVRRTAFWEPVDQQWGVEDKRDKGRVGPSTEGHQVFKEGRQTCSGLLFRGMGGWEKTMCLGGCVKTGM